MSGPEVRTVADVASVAAALGLVQTDHAVSVVHGQWAGPGVVLTATEDAPGWVRCSVQCRDWSGRLLCVTRHEGAALIADVHDDVATALARHHRSTEQAA